MPEVNERTLYLAWQDSWKTRAWFPVGRLDVSLDTPRYRFRHVKGAERARKTGGFKVVPGFANLREDYWSPELFPVFRNRVMSPRRPEFEGYLRGLDLDPASSADPAAILSVDGGRRVTDSFEVFPKLVKGKDGSFVCRFFLHGWRHTNLAARDRLEAMKPGESLHVTLELTNPTGKPAVQIQTQDYHLLGWAPRYFVHDLMMAMAESPGEYEAKVVRTNEHLLPQSQRVLIEMRSRWEKHEPMSGKEFQPLTGD